MPDTLLEQLRRTRPGFAEECRWHRFLVDAYTGCGGFDGGAVTQPISGYWGAGAEVYAATSTIVGDAARGSISPLTYLDRYPREDLPKFEARRQIAYYLNYVEPLTDLKVSYLLRKPFDRREEPTAVADWRANVDGQGGRWDDLRPTIVTNAAIIGWSPVLIDRPEAEPEMSKAQARSAGLDRWIVRSLAPANLLEWEERDGRFEWCKVHTCRVERDSWQSTPVEVHEYAIWYPDHVERYETRASENGGEPSVLRLPDLRHPFRRVPIAVFRHKRTPGRSSCVMGMPMHGQVSKIGRRLFNLTSEFDEHIRSQVFALLVMVGILPANTQGGEMTIGVDNALTLSPDAKNQHYYLAPPESVAKTLAAQTVAMVQETYRIGRVEYTRPAGGVTSAESRSYEFAQTNRAIADFAAEVARGETDIAEIVGAAEGVSEDKLRAHTVAAPTNFDVENLQTDLKAAADAISIGLGKTATTQIKGRVVDQMLPALSVEMRKTIEAELEELANTPPPPPPPTAPVPGKPPVPPPAPPPA